MLVETVRGSVGLAKSYFFNVYLFIWLCRVLVAACSIFIVAAESNVLTRNQTPDPLVLEAWSFNHWTTREVPGQGFLEKCSRHQE